MGVLALGLLAASHSSSPHPGPVADAVDPSGNVITPEVRVDVLPLILPVLFGLLVLVASIEVLVLAGRALARRRT